RRVPYRRALRVRRAAARSRRGGLAARPALDVERSRAVRREGARARADVRRELLQAVLGRRRVDSRRRPGRLADALRVVVLTQIPPVAAAYTELARALGHDVPAVIVGRPYSGPADSFVEASGSADVVFATSKHSIGDLLRAYRADVGLCTGFPWL